MRVLIVEGDAGTAEAYAQLARMNGYKVVGPAADATAALALAHEARPDLALLDVRLADGDTGGELAVRLHEECETLPVFVTDAPHLVPAAAKAICAGLLVKPVSPDYLATVMRGAALTLWAWRRRG